MTQYQIKHQNIISYLKFLRALTDLENLKSVILHLLILKKSPKSEGVLQIEELVVTCVRVIETLFERYECLALDHIVILTIQIYTFSENKALEYTFKFSVHFYFHFIDHISTDLFINLFDRTDAYLRRFRLILFLQFRYIPFIFFYSIHSQLTFIRFSVAPNQYEQI